MTQEAWDAARIEQNSLTTGKWANLVMAISGVVAAYLSHSDALLVDGLYSGVNFISAVVGARVTAWVRKPADRGYPFGYETHETLYVQFRSLILLGILTFAIFNALAKIFVYATGGDVPPLVFGPILVYAVLMVVICFSLAAWHHHNWRRSGATSDVLQTEAKAAVVDGVLSAGAGGGLLVASFFGGTFLGFVVPIADALVVLIMSSLILAEPWRLFRNSLREVAGASAAPEITQNALMCTQEVLRDRNFRIHDVVVTRAGRRYFVVPLLCPYRAVTAEELDAVRADLEKGFQKCLGPNRTEIIVTAEGPFVPEPGASAASLR